jgi:amino-acid N-acetyltransferase
MPTELVQFRAGTAADAPHIHALLQGDGLPTEDLLKSAPEFIVGCDATGQIVAAGALQRFGQAALLRSVVVAPSLRRKGLGRGVVLELERVARAGSVKQLVLLTQTASLFFERQGYRRVDRSSVPEDVQGADEFRTLCPASAICMAKSIAVL